MGFRSTPCATLQSTAASCSQDRLDHPITQPGFNPTRRGEFKGGKEAAGPPKFDWFLPQATTELAKYAPGTPVVSYGRCPIRLPRLAALPNAPLASWATSFLGFLAVRFPTCPSGVSRPLLVSLMIESSCCRFSHSGCPEPRSWTIAQRRSISPISITCNGVSRSNARFG